MNISYLNFIKSIFKRDNNKCYFCDSKGYHILYLNPSDNTYSCLGYHLNEKNIKTVCLRCYFKKLNSNTKTTSYHQTIWKTKK